MPGFGDLVQKAFYLGVGIASYAGEKAGTTLSELQSQAQKIADEMVARGEITTEDAKKLVDEMLQRAQTPGSPEADVRPAEPRRIEILEDDAPEPEAKSAPAADDLRSQVAKLQEELNRLRNS